jgi:uncharacterized membrane protein YdjX (TVP38/TMEM64 family)
VIEQQETPNAITDERSSASPEAPARAPGTRGGCLPRLLLGFVLVGAAAWAIVNRGALDAAFFETDLAQLGAWAPIAFVATYVVSTVLLLPGSVLTLAAGAIFGPILGALYSLAGATIGATFAFLIARYLAADLVERRTGPRLHELLEGVARLDWRFVAFVRLVPLLPFNALNYTLGVTKIRLVPYVAASAICMAPGAAVYAYLGYAGREVASGREGSLKVALLALSLLGALSFVPSLVRRLRARECTGIEA